MVEVQAPGNRRLGVVGSPTRYKMDENIGSNEARIIEDQLFQKAAETIKTASQDYSDRPSIETNMRPNLDFIEKLMENHQDVRNARSLYEPRFSLYIAEALAEQHRGCAHMLSNTPTTVRRYVAYAVDASIWKRISRWRGQEQRKPPALPPKYQEARTRTRPPCSGDRSR